MNFQCLLQGESRPFTVIFNTIEEPDPTIGDLTIAIKHEKNAFKDVDANQITLWKGKISTKATNIFQQLKDTTSFSTTLNDLRFKMITDEESGYEIIKIIGEPIEETVQVFIERPPNPQVEPPHKRRRIEQNWQYYTAADGNPVFLPTKLIDMLKSDKSLPKPRDTFRNVLVDLAVGDTVNIPDLGQRPKHFGHSFLQQDIIITKQMVDLWNDISKKKESSYKRVLSGPMGVGKSYLAMFLAAMAYASDWLVLYVADAAALVKETEDDAAEVFTQYFLALNKDILTSTDLESMVEHAEEYPVYERCVAAILGKLLKQTKRKTLLVIDEHGALFKSNPPMPEKFLTFYPLMQLTSWDEQCNGSHVIFTGTSHASFERKYLDYGMLMWWVEYVGPLSEDVFRQLLNKYHSLKRTDLVDLVVEITNCVPRELMYLSDFTANNDLSTISVNDFKDLLKNFKDTRASTLLVKAKNYFYGLQESEKNSYIESLTRMFLLEPTDFEWKFLDFGLAYREKNFNDHTHYYALCPSAKKALFDLYLEQDLPPQMRSMILNDTFDGIKFEEVFFFRLMTKRNQAIILNTTDLNNQNPGNIILQFIDYKTISSSQLSLGKGCQNVLARGFEGYPRFDFMLGPIFIQTSISDFQEHNKAASKDIAEAFNRPMLKAGQISVEKICCRNQIEVYLDEMFEDGAPHKAEIDSVSKRFVVVDKHKTPVAGFRIVYIRGSPGDPSHSHKVKDFPDIAHVSYEELKKTVLNDFLEERAI